ncbi:MAG: alpha/beta fold hydrolase [Reyranella sp.]|nr:alpha/beta fold hydrolase [Reyranella sp.]
MPKLGRDGVEIYYEVHGSGPPLLLTHGYSSTGEMWHGQVEALSRHHQLVLWDMRGHGRSKVVIPAAGHAVNIDQPQAFIDAVLPFLDSLDAGKTRKAAS